MKGCALARNCIGVVADRFGEAATPVHGRHGNSSRCPKPSATPLRDSNTTSLPDFAALSEHKKNNPIGVAQLLLDKRIDRLGIKSGAATRRDE